MLPLKRWCPTTTVNGVTTQKSRLETSRPWKPHSSHVLSYPRMYYYWNISDSEH